MNSPSHADSIRFLLILSRIPGIGPSRANAIIECYGADPSLLDAGPEAFARVPGIGTQTALQLSTLLGNRTWRYDAGLSVEKQLDLLPVYQAELLTILDPGYPPLLKEIYDPPTILFVRGKLQETSTRSVAVVGTRRATAYGKQAVEMICRDLVVNSYTIVSGLAYGIDTAAHRTAVDSGGTTVAVLAGGADIIYTDPAGKIWPKIIENGAIVSEEWFGTEPAPGNFPRRNRIISGLAAGTLIVESDSKGGSMITASFALEQNREVFAVPGSIFSKSSRGTNLLIQRCQAKPVFSAEDIMTELHPLETTRKEMPDSSQISSSVNFTPDESAVLAAINDEPVQLDVLSEITGIDIPSLMVILFELEIKRAVIQLPGQFFSKSIRPGNW
jgi:DNA processing protein